MDNTRIVFSSKFTNVKPINDEFSEATAYVCAAGKNRNFSHISKENIENAIPTLWNIPVVAHVFEDENGKMQIGGHDYVIAKDSDGNYMYKSLCVPYGVVPERPDSYEWEDVEEPDGRGVFSYLKVPVIIWTGRYPELTEAFVGEGKMASQSMEITVNEYQTFADDPNYTDITNFTFSALTLLGQDVEPCFPEAKVVDGEFSLDESFNEMFATMKDELSKCFRRDAQEDTNGADADTENKPNLESDTAAFAEDLDVDAPQQAVDDSQCVLFSATYKEIRNALFDCLKDERTYDEQTGTLLQETCYYVVDFDDKKVYYNKCVYTCDSYTDTYWCSLYAFNNDTKTANIIGEPTQVVSKWITLDEEKALDEMSASYAELVEYKNRRDEEDKHMEYDAAIEEFSNMSSIDEFDTIYQNRYSYATVEDLKNACYLIRGKYSVPAPKKDAKEPCIPIENAMTGDLSILDRFHREYGRK